MQTLPYVVIMAGGVGTRFWPMSRATRPKQFLDVLNEGRTLIQSTYDRFLPITSPERVFVVTNSQYGKLVREQLPEVPVANILLEPVGRNTAPCVGLAMVKGLKRDPDAVFVVTPADHFVNPPAKFLENIRLGVGYAAGNRAVVTVGIKPTRPDTGYGYIQYVRPEKTKRGEKGPFPVKTFTEKPALEVARTFLRTGEFLWNSGIFIFRGEVMREAFAAHLPETLDLLTDAAGSFDTPEEAKAVASAYARVKSISIDHGVMEKIDCAYVIPASFSWSDVGSWGALYTLMDKRYGGNAIAGGNVAVLNGKGNIVVNSEPERLVIAHGVNDLVIVQTENALLICKRKDDQSLREIVRYVKDEVGEQFI